MDEMDSVEKLVRSARAGDEAAFAELYRKFHGRIFRFVLQMSGSKTAAEDILQEVFLLFLQKLHSFDETRSSLSSYLYGIARNMVFRWLEKHREEVPIEVEIVESVPGRPDSNPFMELNRDELISRLRKALLGLPASYREVIVLCELQELTYSEAASVMGCAVGTVRSRLHRARALLLQKLHCLEKGSSEKESGGMAYELSTL